MKIYLVGGAVRDKLLGLPIKEKDFVVVGADPDEMLRLGFRPVGKDFPVFLHPKTKEEYALARTERKKGRGYTAFEFNATPDVTLEEDLKRRDLTINAMAETRDGELIDPYHGLNDLKQKMLRHVSPAFVEDPVRILRVGRFAARFAHLGFKVSVETTLLMQKMVAAREVESLVPERVWKELERGLAEQNPEQFFEVLDSCGALSRLFPEISLNGEGLQALVRVTQKTNDTRNRFAALFVDVPEVQVKRFCNTYRVPNEYRDLALLVSKYIESYRTADKLTAEELVDFFQAIDAYRREQRFKQFLQVSAVTTKISAQWLLECFESTKKIDVNDLIVKGYTGKDIAIKVKEMRIASIREKKRIED